MTDNLTVVVAMSTCHQEIGNQSILQSCNNTLTSRENGYAYGASDLLVKYGRLVQSAKYQFTTSKVPDQVVELINLLLVVVRQRVLFTLLAFDEGRFYL